jgi:Periplasmic binding protein
MTGHASPVGSVPRLRIGACLSLTGRYARFGLQAARGLETWQALGGDAELVLEDDASDPARVAAVVPDLAGRCDLLLGPYSTQLMRAAARALEGRDRLIWNHGGSGDDVEGARPGRVVSVLTPASRYGRSYVRRLAAESERAVLWIVEGRGSFGRQVAAGAAALARDLRLEVNRIGPGDELPGADAVPAWDLLCAGSFEEDVDRVNAARALPRPPRTLCAVAAGVRELAQAVPDREGVFGIAQWFPGSGLPVELGPAEDAFSSAYSKSGHGVPDYPAVQAAAGAVLATHCARLTGGSDPGGLWSAAVGLDTTTLFGRFRIDPRTGAQVEHQTALVRWTAGGLGIAG